MFENCLVISSYSFNFWISSSGSSVAVDTCSSERPIDRRRRAVASFSFAIPFSIPFFSSNFLVAYISRIFLMSSSYSSSSSRESLRRSPISANLRKTGYFSLNGIPRLWRSRFGRCETEIPEHGRYADFQQTTRRVCGESAQEAARIEARDFNRRIYGRYCAGSGGCARRLRNAGHGADAGTGEAAQALCARNLGFLRRRCGRTTRDPARAGYLRRRGRPCAGIGFSGRDGSRRVH